MASLSAKILVLDGDLAVFDQQLRSRFDWLRPRQPAEIATPPVLITFDVLYLKGRDLSRRRPRDRRPRLDDLLTDADLVHPVRRLAPNGLEAWAQVLERGYEGMVAKDNASPYVGGPTRLWQKVNRRTGRRPSTAGGGRWTRWLDHECDTGAT